MKAFLKALLIATLLLAPAMSATREELIRRSRAARHDFVYGNRAKGLLPHSWPATGLATLPCNGYVIDHIKALACNGSDTPANMQWQTVAEARKKDKWERKQPGCPGYLKAH